MSQQLHWNYPCCGWWWRWEMILRWHCTRTQCVHYSYTYTYACTFPPYWRQRNMAIISSLTLKCWFCGFTFGNIRKYTPFPDNDEILIWVIMMMMPSKVAAVTTEWLIITSGPPTDLSACFSLSFLNAFLVFWFYLIWPFYHYPIYSTTLPYIIITSGPRSDLSARHVFVCFSNAFCFLLLLELTSNTFSLPYSLLLHDFISFYIRSNDWPQSPPGLSSWGW